MIRDLAQKFLHLFGESTGRTAIMIYRGEKTTELQSTNQDRDRVLAILKVAVKNLENQTVETGYMPYPFAEEIKVETEKETKKEDEKITLKAMEELQIYSETLNRLTNKLFTELKERSLGNDPKEGLKKFDTGLTDAEAHEILKAAVYAELLIRMGKIEPRWVKEKEPK